MEKQNIFHFTILGVKSSVLSSDFNYKGIGVKILATSLSDANDKIREYLSKQYLTAGTVVLEKIDLTND